MTTLVHEFDWPDRVVVGTVGEPGSRAFYLQARTGTRSASVLLEKAQSAVLADTIDRLLDELMREGENRYNVPADASPGLVDDAPLDQPVEPDFRAGQMRLSWDPRTAQVVVEAYAVVEDDPDLDDPDLDDLNLDDAEAEPAEMLVVRMPVGTARAFVRRTRDVVRSGRPLCPLCGAPVEPDGHECRLTDDA